MNPCKRKCHDCGNVAMHEDRITPWVLCKKCGSQDTRLVKDAARSLSGTSESAECWDVGADRDGSEG